MQIGHRLQPLHHFRIRIHHQAEAVVLRVKCNDKLVLGVQPSIDVKAALQHNRTFRLAKARLELLLRFEVVETRRLVWSIAEQHKVTASTCLQLLQVAVQHDVFVARRIRRIGYRRLGHGSGRLAVRRLSSKIQDG